MSPDDPNNDKSGMLHAVLFLIIIVIIVLLSVGAIVAALITAAISWPIHTLMGAVFVVALIIVFAIK